MVSHLWLRTAAEVFAANTQVQTVLYGAPDDPLACAALYAPNGRRGTLRLLGALDLGESVDLPAKSDEALSELARNLWSLGAPIDLGHVPTDTRLVEHLRRHKPAWAMIGVRARDERGLPGLVLDDRWADPMQTIGRKRRQSLARKRRRAEADCGAVRFRLVTPTAETARQEIDRAFRVEASSWKSRAGTAIVQQPEQSRFFHLYGERAAERGILRLAFLEIGGEPAAVHYGVEIDGIFWSLRVGYDERFAAYSPGDLLMLELVKDCVDKGLSRLELCGKEADWTQRWSNHARPIAAVRLYPRTPRGFGCLTCDVIELALRKTRERLWDRVART